MRTAVLLDSIVLRVGPVIYKKFFQIIVDCICRPYIKDLRLGGYLIDQDEETNEYGQVNLHRKFRLGVIGRNW